LPNAVIIGAQKCGTSALHYYLGLHPEIFMSAEKELHFFVAEQNWRRGIEWYKKQFQCSGKRYRIYGESTPAYSRYPLFKGVAERMASLVPDAKLIYLVRDPIDRAIAQYQMEFAKRRENRPIVSALQPCENNLYVAPSLYAAQLDQFLRFYRPEQVLIVPQSDLLSDRKATLMRIFSFLEVDTTFYDRRYRRTINPASRNRKFTAAGLWLEKRGLVKLFKKVSPKVRYFALHVCFLPFSRSVDKLDIPDGLRVQLNDFLSEDIRRFRDMTGQSLADWSV